MLDRGTPGKQGTLLALAGGVGGAKLASGLYRLVPPHTLSVIVNTGDDFDLYSLRISPDADTVLYTLADLANPTTGWGIEGDTFETLGMMKRLGEDTWFLLGDRDFAIHILRTQRLLAGATLTSVLDAYAQALGVRARLLPMSDDPVATVVRTQAGELSFQDYFVRRHHGDDVLSVRFANIERARPTAQVEEAISAAETIVFCPSNPIVSIGPILAVPGLRDRLLASPAPKIAVSPIVGGQALRGPAAQMLASLGHESSAYAVAALYRDLLTGMVIDHQDRAEAPRIEALGMRVLVTDTIMSDTASRERLAGEVLRFAGELRG